MKRQVLLGLVGGLLVSGWSGPAFAAKDKVDILLEKLVQKGILTSEEAGSIRQEVVQTEAEASQPNLAATDEAHTKALAKAILPKWVQDWTWSGDIRLREESRNGTGSGSNVNLQRIRFRLGADAKVSDNLRVGARLATGSGTDPISTNQSFNTSFNRASFLLDRAYVAYTPEVPGLDQVKLTGGIIENPFWTVSEVQWDEDLNFDGAAAHAHTDLGPVNVFVNGGVFSLQTALTEAASLWSIQGGGVIRPFPDSDAEALNNVTVKGALAYHDYKNVTNPFSENNAFALAGGSSTTTPAAPTATQLKGNTAGVQDFNLLNIAFQVASTIDWLPCKLWWEWVHNTAVAQGNNGFQVGLGMGKAKTPFDLKEGWEAGYYFERLEPDATFGPFAGSDFGASGTNHRGNVWWVKLAMLKNSQVGLKYYSAQEVKQPKSHEDRLQVDWVTKF